MSRMIVVGVHELETSTAALEWALRRAEALDAPVTLVHTVPAAWLTEKYGYYDSIISDEQALVRQIESRAAELAPTVTATGSLRTGSAQHVLRELSEDASLIVVGTHRKTGISGDYFGSVSMQVAAQSACPVAVVPPLLTGDRTGVVVGVDGSIDARDAMEFAAAEADRTGQELTAVYAARVPTQRVLRHIPEESIAERLDEERVVLAESVAGLTNRYPDLVVHQLFVADETPARALMQAAATAQLLVVGSHGRGALSRLWMGSVSHEVLGHAPCPTVVTRTKRKKS
ncbi:universal stress protein [Cryobacterium psychrophilum]|uniref:Universal stress protein n=1 Tax=Cryobacterium psychrophilum TaxID=41988 RepID=A0A4Y8KN77_9MICO|nr:universal stress protein [Cryobacterium psychrophilum]TDW30475.1 nucleotide-binding universal stress UspA family protein [Cryobacterium psychrophilum]TFD79548.1 universal stress protein [Cryobacterium psychrophilum]